MELKECCGLSGERGLAGLQLTCGGNTFAFPSNIPSNVNTAGKSILIATDAFTNLPGAPTRDFDLPDGFIITNGCTLNYNNGFYDTFVFSSGQLPLDGVNSIQLTSWSPDTFTTAANTPRNLNNNEATVDACVDTDGDGYGSPGEASCPNGAAADCNNNNSAVHPNAVESAGTPATCSDNLDNDCDTLTDCAEAACANAATEICTDNIDNDCDGDMDCADSQCASVIPDCVPTVSEWGLAALALILANAGTVLLARRRPVG